jgi:hypothetical protein
MGVCSFSRQVVAPADEDGRGNQHTDSNSEHHPGSEFYKLPFVQGNAFRGGDSVTRDFAIFRTIHECFFLVVEVIAFGKMASFGSV